MKLIDKDVLVAEIKRRISLLKANESGVFHTFASEMIIIEYENMLSFLDTLEVKEVDLDFMLHEYWNLSSKITIDCLENVTMTKDEMINFAKHFFELGLAQKGE